MLPLALALAALILAYVLIGLFWIDGVGYRFHIHPYWRYLQRNRLPDYPDRRYDLKHWHVWRWKLKQLMPLTYWTTYEAIDSKSRPDLNHKEFCIWRMYLGRSYRVTRAQVL